jgi:tRNA U38,U39,U40 pseudouridine synthase TruA
MFLEGKTDVNTFDCTIFWSQLEQNNNRLIFFTISNRFLRNMVRSIVGTLVNVGLNKITLDDFNAIIVHKNRDKVGFQYQHICIWLKLNTIIYKNKWCKTICKLEYKTS